MGKNSPYCEICSGCGEEGCCSPLICKQHPEGDYCESYLRDLKFGYAMTKIFQAEIYEKMSEELKKEYDRRWDEEFDKRYKAMKVYKVELMIIDFDEVGEEIKEIIENQKYPNYCISPSVASMESREIEWDDKHPINSNTKWKDEFKKLFDESQDQ